jgi:hypothetical protein
MNWFIKTSQAAYEVSSKGTHSLNSLRDDNKKPQGGYFINHEKTVSSPGQVDCNDVFIWCLSEDKIDYKKMNKGFMGKLTNYKYDDPSTFSGYFDKCNNHCIVTPPHDERKARSFNILMLVNALKQIFGTGINIKMTSNHYATDNNYIKEANLFLSEKLKK